MNTKKILIIDKDHDSLSLLSSRLKARDYHIVACDSSAAALSIVIDEVPDLILIDSRMDKVEGEELPLVIKKNTHNFFIPIVMMAEHDSIAEQIMGMRWGFDDIIIKPCDSLELQLRIGMNLKRAQESVQANPLTKLPGNIAIERALKEKIASGKKFSVCYIDIDNFKSFNDKYSFDKGDNVLVQTSRILLQAIHGFKDGNIFVGHVGGDDFVVILNPEREESFARKVIQDFDQIIPTYYSKEDQEAKEIIVRNRRGSDERFPVMSISIAVVTNLYVPFSNPGEIAAAAAEVKKYLKTQPGSTYLRDRRAQQIENLDEANKIFHIEGKENEPSKPFGQMLLAAGLITDQQLEEALKKHFVTKQRLGRVLIGMKALTSEKVGGMLEKKLGVPYVSLKGIDISSTVRQLFTSEYMKTHGAVPFKIKGKQLHVAMIDPFDVMTIRDIEQMTECTVYPSIILEEEFNEFVEDIFEESV
ncbi:MAG: diguanylate cyclase [Candidatus Omnitrophica bacterium]|nr:diguanylate cyclase [Candidatus Omnitrophota bacterium]